MTIYHLGALLVAAGIVLGCGMSTTCSHEGMAQAFQLSSAIVGGVFGLAQAGGAMKERTRENGKEGKND